MKHVLGAVAGVALSTVAFGQVYNTGFELPPYTASAAGVPLSGQNGWYTPAGVGMNVHTYAGNAAGLVQNPVGGNQFIAGVSQGGTNLARAQINYPFASTGVYSMAWDMAPVYLGTPPSAANLGSVSMNHSTLAAGAFRGFISLNNFVDVNNPSLGWKVEFNVFDAAGTATNNLSPGSFWSNLQYNHWYRQFVNVNLSTNQVLSITLVDLHTGLSGSVVPSGWYLNGGANTTLPAPDAFRFFAGGQAGNTMGYDNLNIVPAPASLGLLGLAGVVAARRRRR